MKNYLLQREQIIDSPRDEVFHFFQHPENLRLLTPAWLGFRILTPLPIEMKIGATIEYTIRFGVIRLRWKTVISAYEPPLFFADDQVSGPYTYWHHTHTFKEIDKGTLMIDEVYYRLPFGIIGQLAHLLIIKNQLDTIFDYRTKVIKNIFQSERQAAKVHQ